MYRLILLFLFLFCRVSFAQLHQDPRATLKQHIYWCSLDVKDPRLTSGQGTAGCLLAIRYELAHGRNPEKLAYYRYRLALWQEQLLKDIEFQQHDNGGREG